MSFQATVQWTSPRWPGGTACPPSPSPPWTRPSSLCWRWPPSWALRSSTTGVRRAHVWFLLLFFMPLRKDRSVAHLPHVYFNFLRVNLAPWHLLFTLPSCLLTSAPAYAGILRCRNFQIDVATWQHFKQFCLKKGTPWWTWISSFPTCHSVTQSNTCTHT